MRPASLLLAVALIGASSAHAQDGFGPVDGRQLPPMDLDRVAVGTPAPDFRLPEFGGGEVILSQFRGSRNVVLVFYRGYWCPYCIRQLAELRSLLDSELERDTELLVVSVDGESETRTTVARISRDSVQPDFRFLMDEDHAVIDRYGILNQSGSRRGIPHPATYVIDKSGIVRWRDVQTDYTIRPTNDQILAELRALR